MSSTNKTTYYDLPQFVDSDLFNPLVDDNDAYDKIDTALHNIADAEAGDASEIVGVKSRVTTVEGKVADLEAQNGDEALATTAQTLSGAVNELDADVASLDGRADIVEDDINNVNTGLKAKVRALEIQNGNEVLNTNAQTLSGGINELKSLHDNYKVYNVINHLDLMTNNDLSTVINALLNLDTNPIKIYIPNGIYICKTSIVIPKANCSICGESRGAQITIEGNLTHFINLNSKNNIVIENLDIDCAYHATNGIYSDGWCSELIISNVKIGHATTGISIPTYLSEIKKCWIYNCTTGIELKMFETTRSTSTNITECFVSDSNVGYDLSMTYSNLIGCASDRNEVGYYVKNSQGVNLIGCGAERNKKVISCDSWWGGSVIGFYGLDNGDASYDNTHYIFDLASAVNIVFAGYQGSIVGTPKLLRITSTSLGSENISVLDYSIRKNQIDYVSNYAFKKPIKLLRGDELGDDRTVSFDNIADLSNYLRNEMPTHIDYTLTINITADMAQTSSTQLRVYNVHGSGRIIFNLNGHTITSPTNEYKIIRVLNSDVTVCVVNGTLLNAWNSNNQQLVECVNGKMSFKGITFSNPTGYKAGSGITAKDGAFVIVGSDCVKDGIFEADSVYEFMDDDDLSYIVVKATF